MSDPVQQGVPDDVEKRRIRWRSRRGLLELDLVITRFLAHDYDALTSEQFAAYCEMLEWPDNDLLDIVNAKVEVDDPRYAEIIAILRRA